MWNVLVDIATHDQLDFVVNIVADTYFCLQLLDIVLAAIKSKTFSENRVAKDLIMPQA